ncbi:MAG TPA: winged helix-turn-helix domain-containing protein [Phenylobacterium sp.]|jgi:TolB-like protein/DNA-binding winged helix-turn-helix (wHTH) protein|uniref:winged helix-turn-helix domain-containing protein n=1 Tax=Phenylobacterium sp. TaxID=1871053 RepID=UPI002D4E4D88|nr:winged helix-turn-helix domain-containing protein [Phenylobacterium sp.]HZZ67176.1 winged helix-turn-helix domain-containing protein [Phenylobacterium sp.]
MDQLARTPAMPGLIDLAREPDFKLGGLAVRPSRLEVEGFGVRRTLQPRVMQVLVALMHPTSEVVSHDELIRRCWGGLAVGEGAVRRCIGQLRKLTSQWPEPPFSIETIGGVGYQLEREPSSGDVESPPSPRTERRLGRRAWWALAAAALLLLALGALRFVRLGDFGVTPPAPRVAVLPLEALSGRPEARYVAAGVADEVSQALSASQVEALPRTDVAALQRAAADPKAAAQLGVGLVLSGSVQDVENDTLVNVQLDDARTHVTLWSGDFRRVAGDAGALREEVAAKVADLVGIAEYARENPRLRRDDAAMSAVLAAHDLVRRNRRDSWGQLLALTQQVVTREPDFAFGHAMAAVADAYAIQWGAPAQQRPALVANGRREAARAIALDPQEAGSYFALQFLAPDYRGREAALLKGLATATHPAAPLAALYTSEGSLLLAVGRAHEALPYIQRSVSMDPLSAVKAASLVDAYVMVGDMGAAQELIDQALARWPNHPALRAARLHLAGFYGDPAAARTLLMTPASLPGDLAPEALAAWRAFLAARPSDDAQAARRVAHAANGGALDLRTAVLMLAQLHDLDDAFSEAERIASQPDRDPKFLFEPGAAPLRRDRRFMDLATRFDLVGYWRGVGHWPDACPGARTEPDCAAALAAASH